MLPPLVGLTDQTKEKPFGGLGEAENVVVEFTGTVTGEGLTVSLRGRGFGFGNPFSKLEPLPQLVRVGVAKGSAILMMNSRILAFDETTACGLRRTCATTLCLRVLLTKAPKD